MRIAIGCDEVGLRLKQRIIDHLQAHGFGMEDHGVYDETPSLYPEVAFTVARSIVDKQCDRGILICGTGIGMAIAANKVKGIRAAVCHDPYSAERAARSNNAHIITFGARVIGEELALALLDIFLKSRFDGGLSAQKLALISEYEKTAKT